MGYLSIVPGLGNGFSVVRTCEAAGVFECKSNRRESVYWLPTPPIQSRRILLN